MKLIPDYVIVPLGYSVVRDQTAVVQAEDMWYCPTFKKLLPIAKENFGLTIAQFGYVVVRHKSKFAP